MSAHGSEHPTQQLGPQPAGGGSGRGTAVVALALAMVLVCAAIGFAIGRANRDDATDVRAARAAALREAAAHAERTSYAAARRRGFAAGRRKVEAAAAKQAAEERAKLEAERKAAEEAAAKKRASSGGSCPSGQYTDDSGDCKPIPDDYGGAPPADSPEGKKAIKNDPECKHLPPPPPDYHGPVQC